MLFWCDLDLFLSTGVKPSLLVEVRVDAGLKLGCVDFALFTQISQVLFRCVVQCFVCGFVSVVILACATLCAMF